MSDKIEGEELEELERRWDDIKAMPPVRLSDHDSSPETEEIVAERLLKRSSYERE